MISCVFRLLSLPLRIDASRLIWQASVFIQSDDFDLSEIFAEYFINEFDDPMNAYTSSMANYAGAGVNQQFQAQSGPQSASIQAAAAAGVSLPTGGIRTAFHSGVASSVAPASGMAVASNDPLTKKPRIDPQLIQQHQLQTMSHPGMPLPQQSVSSSLVATQQTVSLPVGVGIRLGGVGGIAPETAVARVGQQIQQVGQFAWGVAAGTGGVAMGVPGGQMDHATVERRQRNREHAKRSRVRKKFMLESLQSEVKELQRENQRLRLLVQANIPDNALQIISECCAGNPLFDDDEGNGKMKDPSFVGADATLMQSLAMGQQCFVLSDPKLPDNPIVFASPGFYKLTGYTQKEVLGRNCRFLQGPGTNPQAVDVIRKAIASGSDATVCLLNYKADGTAFWNQFFIAALRDSDNNIVNYVSAAATLLF
jgi:PAS domain S-box-containing protein